MNKIIKKLLILGGTAALTAAAAMTAAALPSALSILKRADLVEGYRSNYSEMKQTITTSSGSKRTMVIRGWAVNNGDKQLSLYLSPADVKGQKILMTNDGDTIWMYNPETRRTRKLGSHMKKKKVMGSDFTYEDQAGGKLSEKYRGSVTGIKKSGGTDCYVLDLKPTRKGPSYGKVIAWVGKEDYITRRIDYFEKGSTRPFKRLIMEDIRPAGRKTVAHKMTMTNLEDRTSTIMIITKIRFGVRIPASIFLSRNLQK